MFRNKLLMIQDNRYFPCRALTTVLCFVLSVGRIVSIAIRERTLRNVVKAWEGLCDGLRGVRGALPEDATADNREVGLPV